MGAKDSKPSFVSYDDAVKRVSDSELRRIREAFKRCAGANGTALSLEAFVHEVLCDGVPYEVAEWLYQACGGTKRGIAFKDLLCGIVVLTKGNIEEKIKFLWTLYVNNQSDNGTYIYKRDFAKSLHLENTSLPVTRAQKTGEILLSLFGSGEKVAFEQFRSWLLIHKDATVLSQWLLSMRGNVVHDLETPTFYQSLAGVTHLEERDIIELEKCFWSLRSGAASGQLDAAALSALLGPALGRAAAGALPALDDNRDGHVDFKELCCGLSAACRGPRTERLKFCFKIFDMDQDGVLNAKEVEDMVDILCEVANEADRVESRASTPEADGAPGDLAPEFELAPELTHELTSELTQELAFDPRAVMRDLRSKLVAVPRDGRKPTFQLGPSDGEHINVKSESEESPESDEVALTLEDFLIWSVESAGAVVAPFLQLLVETCHVLLPLRPQCAHQEQDIAMGWLRREEARGFAVGQFWYLVGAEWWAGWQAHCSRPAACCRGPSRPRPDPPPADSFTTASTESMGSLVWRADSSSVGSAGSSASAASSGVGSVGGARTGHSAPGPIDNRPLLAPRTLQVPTLTGEGGHLRRDVTLAQHRDFELLPAALWRALCAWRGAAHPLPRQVIRPPKSDLELELYPIELMIFRHVPSTQTSSVLGGVGWGGAPERQLAYTASFSRLATVKQVTEFLCGALGLAREDVRLWALGAAAVLLDDERPALGELRPLLGERPRLLLERRAADLTWPEEIGALSGSGGNRATERRETLVACSLPGATGLHNLGNTCYMNAALQALFNTCGLVQYFRRGLHRYHLNTANPLGTGGVLALRFGELCNEVWSMSARSVAPLRLRLAVARHAPLQPGAQHDAQELLAWLLDGLHEDLAQEQKPSDAAKPSNPDSSAESDGEDGVAAADAAWAAWTRRNRSLVAALFYGQLRSRVRCGHCGAASVRYDAFNMLSVPLPLEPGAPVPLPVILMDGSVPVKYGVRVNPDGTYWDLKQNLSKLCGLAPEEILLAELSGPLIERVLPDTGRVRGPRPARTELVAYQRPAAPAPPAARPEWVGAARGVDEVSAARGGSLCMPALLCFKRSRSEILMSQSPPSAFYARPAGGAESCGIEAESCGIEAETCGIEAESCEVGATRSLGAPTPSPRLSRARFGSSPSDVGRTEYRPPVAAPRPRADAVQYLVAVHRKQVRQESYFLPSQRCRPALFGTPLLVGLRGDLSGRRLYDAVWTQVARLLSPKPTNDQANHATDCDDSLGYEFPFTLRVVGQSGVWCALCPWPRLCRGCALCPTDRPLAVCCEGCASPDEVQAEAGAGDEAGAGAAAAAGARGWGGCGGCGGGGGGGGWGGAARRLPLCCGAPALAIDWEPTALHLRYQSSLERLYSVHRSLSRGGSGGPGGSGGAGGAASLASCLRSFTADERLEQPYRCRRCRAPRPASKALRLWRAPPVLIIHLKRFQFVNSKWVKSQKAVDYPFENFDPTEFLASVPKETILRHRELMAAKRASMADIGHISESGSDADSDADCHSDGDGGGGEACDERLHASSDPDCDCDKSRDDHHCDRDSDRHATDGEPQDTELHRLKTKRRRRRLQSERQAAAEVRDGQLRDFHDHRLHEGCDPFDLRYDLYAVVAHTGQLSGGHYVTYARSTSGSWLLYNDSAVREAAPPAADPAAYLLFYRRRHLQPSRYLPTVSGPPPVTAVPEEPDLNRACAIA